MTIKAAILYQINKPLVIEEKVGFVNGDSI